MLDKNEIISKLEQYLAKTSDEELTKALERAGYRSIDFPEDEIPTLKEQDRILTIRVDEDFSKYNIGEYVKTKWGSTYIILDKKQFENINQYPFYNELTEEQRNFISQYNEYEVLILERRS